MSYELNKDRYHDMNKERTLGLISACNIEIPLLKSDYDYFIESSVYKDFIGSVENHISDIFNVSPLKEKFIKELHLSILPDYINDNFFIGYSPKEVINSIYSILGINKTINLDYSDPISVQLKALEVKETLKRYVEEKTLLTYKLDDDMMHCTSSNWFVRVSHIYTEQCMYKDFAEAALKHVDSIFNLVNYRSIGALASDKNSHIKWRNLAQYIAITSLREYEKNNNELYLEYPYKFYERCTKPDENGKQMLWVDELYLEDEKLDSKFFNYNSRCEKIFKNSPIRVEFLLHYKDNNKLTVLETLNPSSLLLSDEDFGDFLAYKSKKSRVVDSSKERLIAERQLASKIKFYAYDTEFSDHVLCRLYERENNETGYVGFILDNDYIVLDKFFKESLDGKCVPAKDARVYALPISMYVRLGKNSGNIRKFMEMHPECPLVIKKNHTKTDSYTKAVIDITKRESASDIKAEDYIRENGGKVTKTIKTKKKVKKPSNNKD